MDLAQIDRTHTNSPKGVVQKLVKLDLEGSRLTPEGRRDFGNLLILPNTTLPYPINIVSDKFTIDEVSSPNGEPRFNVYFPYLYGWLGPDLRFTASIHMQPGNGLKMEGASYEYQLASTPAQRATQPGASEIKDANQTKEWRIENAPQYGFLSLAAAIRYVTGMRDKTNDPAIKKNASETLAKLKKLH
jgi:hypothetical protein